MPDILSNISITDILGIILIVAGFCMPQLKSIHLILLAELLVNALACVYYLLLNGKSAFVLSIFATLHVVVNFLYQRRGKRPAWWVFGVFAVIYITCGVLTWTGPMDLLSMSASLFFGLALQQSSPTGYRLCAVGKCTSWIIYCFILDAWSTLLTNLFTLLSALAALVRSRVRPKQRQAQ